MPGVGRRRRWWRCRHGGTARITHSAGRTTRTRGRMAHGAWRILAPGQSWAEHSAAAVSLDLRPHARQTSRFALAPVRRADDGLDRPALPLLPSPAHAAHAPVHRDGDHRRAAARRRGRAISTSTPTSIRWRCSSAAASRRTWRAARGSAQRWGYDEINLNCGCPSERVQRGAFGACLMAEPRARGRLRGGDARCRAPLPVTVKHRIGIDRGESYGFVRDFVGTVAERAAARSSSCTRATPG